MKPVSMLCRWSFALVACAVAMNLTGLTAQASPARPPNGVYRYDIKQHGSEIGSSLITFASSATQLTVHETVSLGPLSGEVMLTLDPSTLTEQAYSADVTSSQAKQHIVVTPRTGALNITASGQSADVNALPGSPSLLISDNFVATLVVAPAIVKAANAQSWTFVALSGGRALAATAEPSDVPGKFLMSVNGTRFEYVLDPQSLLVREVTIPSQDVVISLTRS